MYHNLQVEMLFHKFHASVSLRIGDKTKLVNYKSKQAPRRGTMDSHAQNGLVGTGSNSSSPRNEEDVQCPICLLEMVDGESLTICDGCCNTLHQHCMAICMCALSQMLVYKIQADFESTFFRET